MSVTAEQVKAEETKAAEAEGLEPLPADLSDLRAEYIRQNDIESAAKREKEAIKDLINEELQRRGSRMFTLGGKNVLGYNVTNRKELNTKRLEADYGKEVIAGYIENKTGRQFYCAK